MEFFIDSMMASHGVMHGAGRSSIKGAGPLTGMSVDDPNKYYCRAAFLGTRDDMLGPSSCVITGRPVRSGTAGVELVMDPASVLADDQQADEALQFEPSVGMALDNERTHATGAGLET